MRAGGTVMKVTQSMASAADINSQKLLLFAALGYLQCLKSGASHSDDVYRVFGQPRIIDGLQEAGVSESIIGVISGLDEPGWCRESLGEAWFEEATNELIAETLGLVEALGPPSAATEPPTLMLFPKGG
jgi:hypothetical protein